MPDPRIGPHEGRELLLMLEGRKPLAVFWETEGEGTIPEADFEPYVRSGRLLKQTESIRQPLPDAKEVTVRLVLYAPPEHSSSISEALSILLPVMKGSRAPRAEDDARLGVLLGYDRDSVDAFLSARAGS